MTMTADEKLLIADLMAAKKVRSAALRRQRRIYGGYHPCAVRAVDPDFDAAWRRHGAATDHHNKIADRINKSRGTK
jgi:hypothetical protein